MYVFPNFLAIAQPTRQLNPSLEGGVVLNDYELDLNLREKQGSSSRLGQKQKIYKKLLRPYWLEELDIPN